MAEQNIAGILVIAEALPGQRLPILTTWVLIMYIAGQQDSYLVLPYM